MIARCYNPRNDSYKDYGAKGITVCVRWRKDFVHFLADMGLRPADKDTIDRIDGRKGYNPKNCRWATWAEQARNKRHLRVLTIDGVSLLPLEWAEKTGTPFHLIYDRYFILKWSARDAVYLPHQRPHYGTGKCKNGHPREPGKKCVVCRSKRRKELYAIAKGRAA